MKLSKLSDRTYEAIDALAECTHIDPQDDQPERLVHTLALLGELKTVVAELTSLVTTDLLNAAESDNCVITAGHLQATIKPRPAKKRTDWPLLLPAAIEAAISDHRIVNEATGEVEPVESTLARVLPDLIPMTASVSPKTTGLALLGIDRDRFVDTEWAAPSVKLERIQPDTADVDADESVVSEVAA